MRVNGRRVRAGWWRHCLALAVACQIVGLAVPCLSAAPDAPVPDTPMPEATPPAALAPKPAPTGVPSVARGRDLIGAADLLEVRVFELPELQSSVRVKADGTISLPLIGSLAVAGMTEADAEATLKSVLADRYVKDPHVSVLVKEHESRKVSVIGAVVRPGAYPLLAERSLLRIISETGGLTREAGTELLVIRNGGGSQGEAIRVDLQKLVEQADVASNIAVQPGDIINVLADESIYIYVDGAVKSPGQIETRASRPITLLQALIRSGGTTDAANPKQVRVLRKADDGSRETLVVDTRKIRRGKQDDIVLRDGDVVVVPEALF